MGERKRVRRGEGTSFGAGKRVVASCQVVMAKHEGGRRFVEIADGALTVGQRAEMGRIGVGDEIVVRRRAGLGNNSNDSWFHLRG